MSSDVFLETFKELVLGITSSGDDKNIIKFSYVGLCMALVNGSLFVTVGV